MLRFAGARGNASGLACDIFDESGSSLTSDLSGRAENLHPLHGHLFCLTAMTIEIFSAWAKLGVIEPV